MKSRLKRFGYINIIIIFAFIIFLAQSFIERDKRPEVDAYIKSLINQEETETDIIIKNRYEAIYQYDRDKYITVIIKPYEVTTESLRNIAIDKIKESADQQNINLPNGFEYHVEIRLIEYTVTIDTAPVFKKGAVSNTKDKVTEKNLFMPFLLLK